MKEAKVHCRSTLQGWPYTFCGQPVRHRRLTEIDEEVTCGNCQRIMRSEWFAAEAAEALKRWKDNP
jgi:hypothetical protein